MVYIHSADNLHGDSAHCNPYCMLFNNRKKVNTICNYVYNIFKFICAKLTFYELLGQNNALRSVNHVPGLELQSAIFGAGLHASVAELRHLFVEYNKINGYGHAWTGHAISVSGNQLLDESE